MAQTGFTIRMKKSEVIQTAYSLKGIGEQDVQEKRRIDEKIEKFFQGDTDGIVSNKNEVDILNLLVLGKRIKVGKDGAQTEITHSNAMGGIHGETIDTLYDSDGDGYADSRTIQERVHQGNKYNEFAGYYIDDNLDGMPEESSGTLKVNTPKPKQQQKAAPDKKEEYAFYDPRRYFEWLR